MIDLYDIYLNVVYWLGMMIIIVLLTTAITATVLIGLQRIEYYFSLNIIKYELVGMAVIIISIISLYKHFFNI